MRIITTIALIIVALIHTLIAAVEIFFWQVPAIHERLGYSAEIAAQVAPIVQNAGLYNSFIAAGLFWGAFTQNCTVQIRYFFLSCVVIAGIFGAVTLRPTTLILQTLPALIALALNWKMQSRSQLESKRLP
jgi:putative membrane protein